MRLITDESWDFGDELLSLMERVAESALKSFDIDPSVCEVSLTIVSPEEMRDLNAQYRGKDSATDVLSFPMYESAEEIMAAAQFAPRLNSNSGFAGAEATQNLTGIQSDASDCVLDCAEEVQTPACGMLLGDVVICREIAEKQAAEIGQSLERELLYLFVHSVLHLLGCDHENEEDKRAMRDKEKDILDSFTTDIFKTRQE